MHIFLLFKKNGLSYNDRDRLNVGQSKVNEEGVFLSWLITHLIPAVSCNSNCYKVDGGRRRCDEHTKARIKVTPTV